MDTNIQLERMSSQSTFNDVEVVSPNQSPNQSINQSTNQSTKRFESNWSENESSSLLQPLNGQDGSVRIDRLMMPESAYLSAKREIRRFYASQNDFLGSLKKLDSLTSVEETDEEKPSTAAYLAIQISLALTFVLLTMKMFTAVYSGSIAIIASSVDSILDVLSQGTLMAITRLSHKYDPQGYPSGKSRIEPVSILMFSIIMGMASIFLLYVSLMDLVEGVENGGKDVKMDEITIPILAVVVGIQTIMWLYCRRIASLPIPGANAADALAQDHLNDVLINLIGGIPAIVSGAVASAWIADPIGAIALSIYMGVRWTQSAVSQLPLLIGKAAPPEFLNQLAYIAGTHDVRILKIDTITAYYTGVKYTCEVHIVLPSDMTLLEGHDIGESLEQKIEKLEAVETCFVHLDYDWKHAPEHAARAKAAGKDMRSNNHPSPTSANDHTVVDVVEHIPAATMRAVALADSNPTHEPIVAAYTVPNPQEIVHTHRHQ